MSYLTKWRPIYSPTAFPSSFSLANDVLRDFFFTHEAGPRERAASGPNGGSNGEARRHAWTPRVNVRETEQAYLLEAELPGIAPDQVELTLTGDSLVLRGEKPAGEPQEGEVTHRAERGHGAFQRAFTFPEPVVADTIEARSAHGLLSVTVHKAEAARPRQIQIKSAE